MKTLAPAGLSSALSRLALAAENRLPNEAIEAPTDMVSDGGLARLSDRVWLEATFADVTEEELVAALEAAGIDWQGAQGAPAMNITEIMTTAGTLRTFVSGFYPVDELMELDTLLSDAGISGRFIQANEGSYASAVGATTSQGDFAQRSDDARTNFDVDGSDITVGVISDSFGYELGSDDVTPTETTVAQDVASGDLPADYTILAEGTALSSDGDEGRAMAQIIYDVAPDSGISFHTSRGGQAVFANGISRLAAESGAQVIVDDIIYFAEPFFQDGIIAQAATTYYNGGGVYLSSAGNNGDDGFLDQFRGAGVDGNTIAALSAASGGSAVGELHDWNDDGSVFAPYLQVTVAAGDDFDLSFQWDEAFASSGGTGSTSDLDIYVTEVDGGGNETVVDSSIANNLNSDAFEIVGVDVDESNDKTYRIYITEFDAPDNVGANLIAGVFFGASGFFVEDYNPQIIGAGGGLIDAPQAGAPTTFGHANATGALAVGAAAWFNTPENGLSQPFLNSFSSQGGYNILFDTAGNRLASPDQRDGVDFVAPDGGNTTFFGSDSGADADTFPNFFGTSAAAPHAAGVVALLLESVPGLTPDQIEQILEGSATAINFKSTGVAVDSSWTGTGLIDANAALNAAQAFATNSDPIAEDDGFEIDEDNGLVGGGNVFSNNGFGADNDPNGDPLTVIEVNGNASLVGQSIALSGDATAQLDANGDLSVSSGTAYQSLQLGQTASESLTYTVSDGQGGSATATVAITIQGVNDAPDAQNDAFGLGEDDAAATIGNVFADNTNGADTDIDDATFSVSAVDGASANVGGAVTLSGGTIVTIDVNGDIAAELPAGIDALAAGETLVETVQYTAEDAGGLSDTAVVTLTVTGVNDDPDAVSDRDLTEADVTITGLDLLANDSDVDNGDSFTLTSLDTTGTVGIVTDNGDGTIDYDPNGQFDSLGAGEGATDTFTYTITDSQGATATNSVTIIIIDENVAPSGVNDDFSVDENAGFTVIDPLNNDQDGNLAAGDFLQIQSLSTGALLGTLVLAGDGTLSYDAGTAFDSLAEGQSSIDTFSYTLVDGFGATSTASVSITINGENDTPVATTDLVSIDETATLAAFDPLLNDEDVDAGDTISIVNFDFSSTQGVASDNGDGTFSYTPGDAFRNLTSSQSGTDTISYTITDDAGATAVGTIEVDVSGEDNLSAIDDVADALVGVTTTIDVIANDNSPIGGNIFIAGFNTSGTLGRIVGFGENGFQYEAPSELDDLVAGARIADSFGYTVEDDSGEQHSADVAVTIIGTRTETAGDDTIFGTDADESFGGGAGNDVLMGDGLIDVQALLDSLDLNGGGEPLSADGFTVDQVTSSGDGRMVAFSADEQIMVTEQFQTGLEELAAEYALSDLVQIL